MVELAEIGIILQTIGVLSAATAAVIGVRSYINSNKRAEETKKKELETRQIELETRQAQLMMQIYDHINNKDFTEIVWWWTWSNWDEYWKKYGNVPEQVAKIANVFTLFEGIGVLVEQGLINPKLVGDMMGNFILYGKAKLGEVIFEFRRRANSPDQWVKTEFLFGVMMKHYESVHGSKFSPKMITSEI